MGVAVLLNAGVFKMCRCRSGTAAHRPLPVCQWPALGMPWGTSRSNAASAVCSRCGGACTGGCGRGVQVVPGRCSFAGLCKFPEKEAALGNHSTSSSDATVWVARPGHAVGHCKVKCSICCVHQVWWGLHWGLRQGCCAGGLWGLRFCRFVESSRGGGTTRQPQRTEPCQCVSGQLWGCRGAL